jgi:hypothetical protein
MKMLNTQDSMLNECSNKQRINVLNHLHIDYSLTLEHCSLSIGVLL